MRNHKLILRQIAREDLDPKNLYVLGKHGKLISKVMSKVMKEQKTEVNEEESKISSLSNEDFVLPEGAKSIPESLEEVKNSTFEEKSNTKKKSFPAKKKPKVEVNSE
jgi:hypothetical protein